MFAIVDIETTGGSSTQEKITEICVVIHDGLQVVEHYTTLIDPERKIPYRITQLTGITNEMVKGAPKFYEVAKKIVELTDDKIFVAHNVNFDYNFIKNEFKALGFDWNRKKVCTVRMSRKLIPGHRSYSLGNICRDLGIVITGRHRAEGDAFATAKLFDILLTKDDQGTIARSKDLDILFSKTKKDVVHPLAKDLPEETGVYYLHDSEGNIIYIGKSLNIRQRVIQHLTNVSSKKALSMANNIHSVSFEITGSELIALLLESHEIKTHKPLYNRSLVRSVFTYGINAEYDLNGYCCLSISKNTVKSDPIISFVNLDEARNFMSRMVEEFSLCQKLCGMFDSEKACFHYQIKKCDGACIGKESAESYNAKVKKVIDNYQFNKESFFVIDKGRSKEERAVVKIDNGKYCGFGFVNTEEGVNSPEQLDPAIKSFPDNRDVRHILRNHLASGKAKKIPATSSKDLFI